MRIVSTFDLQINNFSSQYYTTLGDPGFPWCALKTQRLTRYKTTIGICWCVLSNCSSLNEAHESSTPHILEEAPSTVRSTLDKPRTFSQAVADASIPGQQGISAVEAQDQRAGQTEDGEGVGHPVESRPRLHAADPLREHSTLQWDCLVFYFYSLFFLLFPRKSVINCNQEFCLSWIGEIY